MKSSSEQRTLNRRGFLCQSAAASATMVTAGLAAEPAAKDAASAPKPSFQRKIKLGVVGCGGRGGWIAKLFQKHGGYEMFALADYFQEAVDKSGDALGVDKSRRFTGLSGYKKMLDSGIEAIAIEDIPYFYPEQATVAVNAGRHVYMAKPVAVDVPGCLAIEAAGKLATQKGLCFHIDYQMPTDPINLEVAKRIHDGGLGKVLAMTTWGAAGGSSGLGKDVPREKTIENRMQGLRWLADVALGCDLIGNFDIHALDVGLWISGERPAAAVGTVKRCRSGSGGDCHDLYFITYLCPSGLAWSHQSFHIPGHAKSLVCDVSGEQGSAEITYWGKSYLRGGPMHYGGGQVVSLYEQGACRNIAEFYTRVVEGRADNPTVRRSVDGVLVSILGRELAARGAGPLSMETILKENKKLEVDLSGLKV